MSIRTRKTRGRKDRRHRRESPKAAGALVRDRAESPELNDPKQASPAFEPSANQLKYLFALRTAATAGENTSDAEMQRLTKISRTTIWEWKHDPAFRTWLGAAMRIEHDHDFELAVTRHLRLAIQGSVRSFEALSRLRAVSVRVGIGPGMGDEQPQQAYSINVLVPRPDGSLK